MASVLPGLSCRKFWFIHALISSRQAVREDDGLTAGWSAGVGKEMMVVEFWVWFHTTDMLLSDI